MISPFPTAPARSSGFTSTWRSTRSGRRSPRCRRRWSGRTWRRARAWYSPACCATPGANRPFSAPGQRAAPGVRPCPRRSFRRGCDHGCWPGCGCCCSSRPSPSGAMKPAWGGLRPLMNPWTGPGWNARCSACPLRWWVRPGTRPPARPRWPRSSPAWSRRARWRAGSSTPPSPCSAIACRSRAGRSSTSPCSRNGAGSRATNGSWWTASLSAETPPIPGWSATITGTRTGVSIRSTGSASHSRPGCNGSPARPRAPGGGAGYRQPSCSCLA